MKSGLPILDSDLHLMEPPNMYQRYLDPSYRDRAPRATSSGAGHYAGWVVAGRPVPPWTGDPEVMRANQALDAQAQALMEEGWATHFDPATTVKAMDAEGIDVAVMFRTSASMIVSIDELDPQYSLALCRAFNDWVADYCREAPSRLKSTAIVPQQDPVLAGQEARRAVEELQALAIVPLPMPISGNHVHDPGFDVLWQELQRLGVPACFHGTSGALSADYVGGALRRTPKLQDPSPLLGLPPGAYADPWQHDTRGRAGAIPPSQGGLPGGQLRLASLVALSPGRPVGEVRARGAGEAVGEALDLFSQAVLYIRGIGRAFGRGRG